MPMKLYYSPGACSLAQHIVLEELQADYTLELVSVSEGTTQSPEYLRINPKGRVPALQSDGRIPTEAPAMLLYLGISAPQRNVLPLDAGGVARCVELLNWLSGTVHAVDFGQLWRPSRFSGEQAQHAAISKKGKRSIFDAFDSIGGKPKNGRFVVGGRYSVVDAYLLVFFRWETGSASTWERTSCIGPGMRCGSWNAQRLRAASRRKGSWSGDNCHARHHNDRNCARNIGTRTVGEHTERTMRTPSSVLRRTSTCGRPAHARRPSCAFRTALSGGCSTGGKK